MGIVRIFSNDSVLLYLSLTARLLLACALGGVIGYERESTHRPAGFRTHILVCVGSALVMITSEFIFRRYSGNANMDPARLGAQVISGIGFLGAGTIIREGISVRGLTTAASLWAVSCVGIAAGIGFYEGAVAATIIIYLTLIFLKKLENRVINKNQFKALYVQYMSIVGKMGEILAIFENRGINVKKTEFIEDNTKKSILVRFLVKFEDDVQKGTIIEELHNIEGIQKVFEK